MNQAAARPYPPQADPERQQLEHCVDRALPRRGATLMLGIFQPNESWCYWPTTFPTRTSWTYDYNLAVVRLAERIGLDFAFPAARWKGIKGDRIDYRGVALDTMTLTAGLLQGTSRITILTTIHTNVFNPVVAAKIGADLDHIGHGRWGLNIVSGWGVEEFQSMGIPLLNHKDRYKYTAEWLQIIRELWQTGECTFHSEYFDIEEAVARPRPMQAGGPLTVNAGQSYTGMRFAAQNVDYLFSYAKNGDLFRTIRQEVGRDVGVIGAMKLLIRPTKAEAEDLASDILTGADRGAVRAMWIASGANTPETAAERMATPGALEESIMDDAVIGDPQEAAIQIAERAAARGLDGICFQLFDYERDLELIAKRMLPALREQLQSRGLKLSLATGN